MRSTITSVSVTAAAGSPEVRNFSKRIFSFGAVLLLSLTIALGGGRSLLGGQRVDESAMVAHLAALAAGEAGAEKPIRIDWEILNGLNYRTGAMSNVLRQLNGKLVKVPGFMVPLEDDADNVTEFLLVPYFGACVHVPPPPPNQIVWVRMDAKRKAKVSWWDPVWIEGRLRIENVESVYGAVGFQMTGLRIVPYEE